MITPSNKENEDGILKKINKNNKIPCNIPLPKIKNKPIPKSLQGGLSGQTIAVMKMKGMSIETMIDLLTPQLNSASQTDTEQKVKSESVHKVQRRLGVNKEFSQPRKIIRDKQLITKESIELERLQKRPISKSKIKRSDTGVLKK